MYHWDYNRLPKDLWKMPVTSGMATELDTRPVQGRMAPYLGKQYTAEEIWQTYYDDLYFWDDEATPDDPRKQIAYLIRVFDVPALIGQEFIIHSLNECASQLQKILLEQLPTIDWVPIHPYTRLLKKYARFHEHIEAPVDETTNQQMQLELFGRMLTWKGEPVGFGWFRELGEIDYTGDDAPFGEFRLQITNALYSNTLYSHVGIPSYG
jgi:hypothetical protein